MKNQTLSLRRLGLVMKHDLRSNMKSYLLQITFLWIAMLVVICFALPHSIYYPSEFSIPSTMHTLENWFFVFLFGSGCLFASTMGNDISTKDRRINTLMLPASMLEKYLAQWIKFVIVCPLVFYVGWLLMNVLGNCIIGLIFGATKVPVMDISNVAETARMDFEDMMHLLLLYLCVQSFFILGAAFWPRFSCIKTAIMMWVISMVEAFLVWLVVIRPMISSKGFLANEGIVSNDYENLFICVLIAITLFNWIFPYFRFKETDVVQRI